MSIDEQPGAASPSAESIGLQHGTVPFVLVAIDGIADPAKKDWAARTAAGVMLVHELKGPGWNQDHWKAGIEKLFQFGYGRADVKVSRYWDADHPASVERSDAVTLVVHKPGGALVVVCDYGTGGDLVLNVNTEALGLAGNLKAIDMEGGQPLATTADGKVRFAMKRHDFKLILVEGDPPGQGGR